VSFIPTSQKLGISEILDALGPDESLKRLCRTGFAEPESASGFVKKQFWSKKSDDNLAPPNPKQNYLAQEAGG